MIRLIFSYFFWHYTQALKDIYHLAKTYLWFIFHFFSISILSKTLFSPWQKLNEHYRGGFDIGSLFETFVVNTIMRFVGFLIRAVMIIVGIVTCIIASVLWVIVFVTWLFLPFVISVLFISGIRLLL